MSDPFKVKYYETEVKTFWQTHKNEIFLWGGIALVLICVAIFYVKCGHDIPVKGITKPDVVIKKEVQKVVDSKKVDSLEVAIAKMEKDKLSLEGKLKAAQESNRKLAALPVQDFNKFMGHERYAFNTNDYTLPDKPYNLPLHFTDEIHDDTTIYDIGGGGMYVDSIPESLKNITPIWPIGYPTSDEYLHQLENKIDQLQDGAYTSDSLCNEVQKQWVDLSELKDSTIKVLKTDKRILISSFNELGYNSTMKDKAIKDLNRSLRWQKVKQYALLGALGYVAFKTLTK